MDTWSREGFLFVCVRVCEPLKPCLVLPAALNSSVAGEKESRCLFTGVHQATKSEISLIKSQFNYRPPTDAQQNLFVCMTGWVLTSVCVSQKCVCYVCAGMRSCHASVPGLRGKKDDPAQLTVSHAGQNNTITLLLTRTWHTPHLLPQEPHTDRHMLAHEQTYLKMLSLSIPHTISFYTRVHFLKCIEKHKRRFTESAHLRSLLTSFSKASIYFWGCQGISNRLTHFLCVRLPKHCKQASQTNMFSLNLVWLENSRESLLNPWQTNTPVYAEGEAYSNPILLISYSKFAKVWLQVKVKK